MHIVIELNGSSSDGECVWCVRMCERLIFQKVIRKSFFARTCWGCTTTRGFPLLAGIEPIELRAVSMT